MRIVNSGSFGKGSRSAARLSALLDSVVIIVSFSDLTWIQE